MSIVFISASIIFSNNGISERATVKIEEHKYGDFFGRDGIPSKENDGSCRNLLGLNELDYIYCLTTSASPEILIIGDSHALALNSAPFFGDINLKTLLIGANTCAPLDGVKILINGIEKNENCKIIPSYVYSLLDKVPSIDSIYISSMGPFYFTGNNFGWAKGENGVSLQNNFDTTLQIQSEIFYSGYARLIEHLLLHTKKVNFIIDVPELFLQPADCLPSRPFSLKKERSLKCVQDRKILEMRYLEYRKIVQRLKINFPQLNIIDSTDFFCDEIICYSQVGDKILYRDEHHLNRNGSEYLWRAILKDAAR